MTPHRHGSGILRNQQRFPRARPRRLGGGCRKRGADGSADPSQVAQGAHEFTPPIGLPMAQKDWDDLMPVLTSYFPSQSDGVCQLMRFSRRAPPSVGHAMLMLFAPPPVVVDPDWLAKDFGYRFPDVEASFQTAGAPQAFPRAVCTIQDHQPPSGRAWRIESAPDLPYVRLSEDLDMKSERLKLLGEELLGALRYNKAGSGLRNASKTADLYTNSGGWAKLWGRRWDSSSMWGPQDRSGTDRRCRLC